MSDTDRLAALLREDAGLYLEVLGIKDDAVLWDVARGLAARLIAAGVTIAATPAPLDVFWDERAHIVPAYDADGNLERRVDEYATPAPLDVERLAAAMNDAQIKAEEIALGHDLRVPARRILAALKDVTP